MTLPLELGGIHDPATRRALEALSQQFPVTVTGGGGGPPTGAASGDLGGSYPGPTVIKAQSGFTVGGVAVILAGDPAGGDLSGTLPNPQIAAGVIVNADINAAAAIAKTKLANLDVVNADVNAAAAIAESKLNLATDAAAGVGSRRTIGTGALQAAAGNDTRFADARTPTAHHTTHEPGGSDAMAVDAAAVTGSLRTLNTSATSAAAGNRGLPTGGSTSQVLAKNTATDFDVGWATPSGGGTQFYDDLQQGVVASGDCALTVNSTTQVTIAAGTVYVTASGVLTRAAPGSTILGSIPAAAASNFRLDQVVVSSAGAVSRLAGTQGTTVTLANRTGAASVPAGSLLLHDVLVASTGVTSANCRDRRLRARGSRYFTQRTAGNLTNATTTHAVADATNLQARIECSGAPVTVTLQAEGANGGATNGIGTNFQVDGSLVAGSTDLGLAVSATAGAIEPCGFVYPFTPAAGSHLITVTFRAFGGTTATLQATTATPVVLMIEEDIRPSANNGTS